MYKRLAKISFLALTSMLLSCAALEPKAAVEVYPKQDTQVWPLDVRFSYVSLRSIRIVKALILLSEVIEHSPQKIPRFSWSIDVEPPTMNPRYNNPMVRLEATNVTLRYVLDKLCAQAGWTYEEGMERMWIFFHPPKQ